MGAKPTVWIVPRLSGRPDDAWYQWLAGELSAAADVTILSTPEPDAPTIESWVESIASAVGRPPRQPASTFLIGHSVGCQAILRYLVTLPTGVSIGGVLCVAGWLTIDDPSDLLRAWCERPLDRVKVGAATTAFKVVISDNDPYTVDYTATVTSFGELGASVDVVAGVGHFNADREPSVRDQARAMLSGQQ